MQSRVADGRRQRLRLITDLPEPPLSLPTDKATLGRIVATTCSATAIKFTGQGSVAITAERPHNKAHLD
jgi:hypothetical protein